MKGDNEPAIISLLYIVSLSKNENMFKKSKIRQIKTTEKGEKGLLRGESNHGPSTCEVNMLSMNDFPVIGDPCFVHRVLGRQGANIASRYKEVYGVELFLR